MSEPQDAIQDLMSRYGFEETEARAYYYFNEARWAYENMDKAKDPEAGVGAFTIFSLPHFNTLRNEIIRRAWEREHPEREERE
jgi:hypothetical protein